MKTFKKFIYCIVIIVTVVVALVGLGLLIAGGYIAASLLDHIDKMEADYYG